LRNENLLWINDAGIFVFLGRGWAVDSSCCFCGWGLLYACMGGKRQMTQRIATRVTPPAPPEFKAQFLKGGWRQIERIYGARTDLLLKWIAQVGGLAALQAERAAMRKGML
jgi:hypothetical protein